MSASLSVLFQNHQTLFPVIAYDLLDLLKIIFPVEIIQNRGQFFFAVLPDKQCQCFYGIPIISISIESLLAIDQIPTFITAVNVPFPAAGRVRADSFLTARGIGTGIIFRSA